MPKAGLEPARLATPPPQDGVSANSTTSAFVNATTSSFLSAVPSREQREPVFPALSADRPLPPGLPGYSAPVLPAPAVTPQEPCRHPWAARTFRQDAQQGSSRPARSA